MKVTGQLARPNSKGLKNCTSEVVGPSHLTVTSSADLAAEFVKDRTAAEKKYHHKYLLVTGEVKAKEGGGRVFLSGSGDTRVMCPIVHEARFKAVNAGERVTFAAYYDPPPFVPDPALRNDILLADIRPVTAKQ